MKKLLLLSLICSAIIASDEPAAAAAQDAKPTLALLKTLVGHTDGILCVKYSPTQANLLASGAEDTMVKLWDPNSGNCMHTLQGHTKPVAVLAYSSDNHLLSATGQIFGMLPEKQTFVWDVATGACVQTICNKGNVVSAAYLPDANTIALGIRKNCPAQQGMIKSICKLWDVRSAKVVLKEGSETVSLQCAHDGSFITAGGEFGVFKFDSKTLKLIKGTEPSTDFLCFNAVLTSNDKYVFAVPVQKDIQQFDTTTMQIIRSLPTPENKIPACVDVTLDNGYVVSGTTDGHVCLFDAATGAYIGSLKNFDKNVTVSCSADNSYVAASSGFCNDIKINSLQ